MVLRRNLVLFLACICIQAKGLAQTLVDPAHWTFEVKSKGNGTYDLSFRVRLDSGWHIWSQHQGEESLFPPEFTFNSPPGLTKIGAMKELGKPQRNSAWGLDSQVTYYEGRVDFVQTVRAVKGTTINGTFWYQVCDFTQCLAPQRRRFRFEIH